MKQITCIQILLLLTTSCATIGHTHEVAESGDLRVETGRVTQPVKDYREKAPDVEGHFSVRGLSRRSLTDKAVVIEEQEEASPEGDGSLPDKERTLILKLKNEVYFDEPFEDAPYILASLNRFDEIATSHVISLTVKPYKDHFEFTIYSVSKANFPDKLAFDFLLIEQR